MRTQSMTTNHYLRFTKFAAFAVVLAVFGASASYGQVTTTIVNDNFSDGITNMGSLQTEFFGTSGSNAVEATSAANSSAGVPSLGLITGTSGRQIHTVFPTQSLLLTGDTLSTVIDFTTPATVPTSTGAQGNDDIRIGLFDTLGRAGLSGTVGASSGSPNPLLGCDPSVNVNCTTTTAGLPGYSLELDVDTAADGDPQNLNIRRSDPSQSGTLLGTNTGISNLSSSSGDANYLFQPNTDYQVSIDIVRNAANGLDITATFTDPNGGSVTHMDTDNAPNSFDFGFLGLGASTNAFGSTNSSGVADNGLEITNVLINFTTAVPEPGSAMLLLGGLGALGLVRRRK